LKTNKIKKMKTKLRKKIFANFANVYKYLLDKKFNRRSNHQKNLDMSWKWEKCFKNFTKNSKLVEHWKTK